MLDIIYEDEQILICHKPAGLAVQSASFGQKDLESMVRTCLAEKKGKADPYLAVVHRLDQPVEGLVVFAKTKKAAASLSAQVQNGRMKKDYLALVQMKKGVDENKRLSHESTSPSCHDKHAQILTDYMLKDGKTNRSYIVSKETKGAKKAVLEYEILEQKEDRVLVRIHLQTGRHHQIRVQMAGAGMPLLGDTKYNPDAIKGQQLALCADHLELIHPVTGKKMDFSCKAERLLDI